MARTSLTIAALAGLTFAVAAPASAAEPSIGQQEYAAKCAMCHGMRGQGDGWFAEHLKQRPPALTGLTKNNGGVFPFERVYEVIDGRRQVLTHGPRDMPVWGSAYRRQAERVYSPYFGEYFVDEGVVRARILALIDYIAQMQE